MSYLRQNGKLIFTSDKEVTTYYATLIDELITRLKHFTPDEGQAIQCELADLRQQLVDQLKNFGHDQVDEYFKELMANAESDQELYILSNAYETILLTELKRIKEKLNALRIT